MCILGTNVQLTMEGFQLNVFQQKQTWDWKIFLFIEFKTLCFTGHCYLVCGGGPIFTKCKFEEISE